MERAIELEHVSKAFLLPHQRQTSIKELFLHPLRKVDYERNMALNDVSVTVERGECLGIIGPNGSGKSTLLKILGGIYRADAGFVRVVGKLSPFIELGVGFSPDLNARENIRINGTLLGLRRRELAERFDDIVRFAELERFVDQKLRNYSSGMQVRLAFAIAIQVPFDILLLDEVLAVGDQAFQEKCYRTFDEMKRDGKTIVFVSHDLASVSRFCKRAILLRQGRVEASGTAEQVVEQYQAAAEAEAQLIA